MDQITWHLGRLVERSEHTAAAVLRIEHRQIGIAREVSAMGERVKAIENRQPEAPAAERWIKRVLAIGAPTATLWATGSAEKAVEVLRLFLH